MASIGHVAVGTALGSPSLKEIVLYSTLALFPDVDVLGFAFGVPYAHTWGHRGATHSIFFALAVAAALAALTFRWAPASTRKVFVLSALALVSHGALDAMTTGGLGPALLWPFTDARYFFAWRPLPVAPIGPRVLLPSGLALMAHEAALFAPFWLIAAARGWRRRRA